MSGRFDAENGRFGADFPGRSGRSPVPSMDLDAYCLVEGIDAIDAARGQAWAPDRREEVTDVERAAEGADPRWCMRDVDIFADLSAAELERIGAATPHRNVAAGELVYTPHRPVEELFILKRGRVRVFRVASDGRALTTALISPGTVFGEMGLVGQHMHDNFAEALEESVVCVLSRGDVQRFLLADSRVAARITEILGRRVAELERRLTDAAYESVPARVASTLCQLASGQRPRTLGRGVQINLTHEQVAALVGTSRETTTKVLGELAQRGLIGLGRGRITVLRLDELAAEAGD